MRTWVILVGLAAALLYAGWSILSHADKPTCTECGRPVYPAARVDGHSGPQSLTFCCAACALRAREQDEPELTITSLRDYQSGDPLAPEEAWAVTGSEVNVCMRGHSMLTGEHGEPGELHYDRCAPSILAFRDRAAAEDFQREQGGTVSRFADVEATF